MVNDANYKTSAGRLATDRFDFEDHINGNNFRHKASSIDLFTITVVQNNNPTTIDGYTLQDAVQTLFNIVSPPIISDATNSTKGVITLSGDISASPNASTITVSGIQSRPIAAITPTNGDVLTFESNIWKPKPSVNNFTAAGDLTGNISLQRVISFSGDTSTASPAGTTNRMHLQGSTLAFSSSYNTGVNPTITQDPGSTDGRTLVIAGQSVNVQNSSDAGNVLICGGATKAGGTGVHGGTKLAIGRDYNSVGDFTRYNMLECIELGGRKVAAFFTGTNSGGAELSSTDMPSGTGDMVMYIRNTASPPTTGSPANGALLYASSGTLRIKQSNGIDFGLGEIPNPSVWGTQGTGNTYSQRFAVTSSSGTPAVIPFSFTVGSNSTVRIDMIAIGKRTGVLSAAHYNLSASYVYQDGTLAQLGTLSITDPKFTSGGSPAPNTWTAPAISNVDETITFRSGYASGISINWFIVIQLTISQTG